MAPRVLIANPGHLGDLLLSLPAVTALRAALPDAHLAMLVARPFAGVARCCPDVDEVIALSFPRLRPDLAALDGAERDRGVAALEGRFDIAILCRSHDPWCGELTTLAGIPARVGYAVSEMALFLTHLVPYDERPHMALQALRLTQRAAAHLGAPPGDLDAMASLVGPPARVRLEPDGADEALVAALLRELPSAGARPIVLQPGSSMPVKSWPPECWGRLAGELRRRYGVTPLVHGGPGESGLVASIVAAGRGACHPIAEQLSIGALAALLRRSAVLVAVDSGPLHLAAVVGLPVVGLYGPLPTSHWSPWCEPERRRIVRVALACSPCDRMFAPPCGATVDAACMTAITVDAVAKAVGALLDGSARAADRRVGMPG